MKVLTTAFLLIGFALFLGLARFLFLYQKPGVYPPRHVIKKQVISLAAGCGVFSLLGFLFYVLS